MNYQKFQQGVKTFAEKIFEKFLSSMFFNYGFFIENFDEFIHESLNVARPFVK